MYQEHAELVKKTFPKLSSAFPERTEEKLFVIGGVYGSPIRKDEPCYILTKIDNESYMYVLITMGYPMTHTEYISPIVHVCRGNWEDCYCDENHAQYSKILTEKEAKDSLFSIGNYLGKFTITGEQLSIE